MLRRVARVARWLLLTLGILVMAWIPVSFFYVAWMYYFVFREAYVEVGDGALLLWLGTSPGDGRIDAGFSPNPSSEYWRAIVPGREGLQSTRVTVPLWLLAFLCLAWPVASFIIVRRRHKRGFPVEPKGGGEAVPPPASSS